MIMGSYLTKNTSFKFNTFGVVEEGVPLFFHRFDMRG